MNEEDRKLRPVTVIGAGIAGLSAAHELVMRGFSVQVIDKDYNEEITRETYDRGIGGMARSQWAIPANDRLIGKNMRRLWLGRELLHDQAIRFRIADHIATPREPVRAKDLLDRYAHATRELERAGVSPSSLAIAVPVRDGMTLDADPRVLYLKAALEGRVDPDVLAGALVEDSSGAATDCIYFVPNGSVVAAEHGFRFFPSFYRHLFDMMCRTTIEKPREFERTKATVFENLVPTEGLGFARDGRAVSFLIPRRAITSFETVRKLLCDVLGELEYTLDDIARFSLKLFKYMTSSSARRQAEYENLSWGDFLGSWRYSDVSRAHIEYGPQMSAALRGSASDSRTQGNITIQLLMDQLKPDAHADYLLAGPTSGAWFNHWHDFLVKQRVTFARGTLEDFEIVNGTVMPKVRGAKVTGRVFILALSFPEIAKLAGKFLAKARSVPIRERKLRDFVKIQRFAGELSQDLRRACPRGPLQHLSGIQFYFDQDVRFWRGHTQYLDSAWGLTSIAQPQFWSRARTPEDQYKSILSVDIGIFDRVYTPRDKRRPAKTAWDCTAQEIAEYVWEQIHAHHDDAFKKKYGDKAVFPDPIAFALDEYLEFEDRNGATKVNHSPFLVNKTSQYDNRPGEVMRSEGKSKCLSCYEVVPGSDRLDDPCCYVLAGTYMQTFTRLTSMESANESARHAVNALLQYWKIGGDRCDIWDPEDNEIDDLQWFKDLDKELLARGLPHFIDILGWSELPDRFGPHHLRALGFVGIPRKERRDDHAE